jgi:Transcriptional regulator containing PAS, AAA-type ATPase, and DNA-binding domains
VLEEGSFRRVGGLKDLPLDVRVIAASNRDLKTEGEAGRFRADLFYRLSVIQIDIPPLRDRGEDIRILAEHYIDGFRSRLRKQIDSISPEALSAFARYHWPGNVRELRNVIERAIILEDGNEITMKYLPRALIADLGMSSETKNNHHADEPVRLPASGLSLEDVEMSLVRQALERSGGNQTKAAELLAISRDQLRYRMKKLEEEAAIASDPGN